MFERGTMTTGVPLWRGQVIIVGAGSATAETVKVRRCVGDGPYTVTVRRMTWLDRLWTRVTAPFRRLRHAVREWRLSRCDARWCWRREAVVDEDWCGWCRVHADGKTVRHKA